MSLNGISLFKPDSMMNIVIVSYILVYFMIYIVSILWAVMYVYRGQYRRNNKELYAKVGINDNNDDINGTSNGKTNESSNDGNNSGLSNELIYFNWRIHIPILFHVLDHSLTMGCLLFYYDLWINSIGSTQWKHAVYGYFCGLFVVIFLYRIGSAIILYQWNKSIFNVLLQFFELYIFKSIYTNYHMNLRSLAAPQKYLLTLNTTLITGCSIIVKYMYK